MPRLLALAAALVPALPTLAGEDFLHLDVGDPHRRLRTAPLVLHCVTDTRSGEILAPSQLIDRLANTRLLLMGEDHADPESHRAQRRLIELLHRSGRPVLIGLEMLPKSEQAHLERWTGGGLTEDAFVEASGWRRHWGHSWEHYRDVFLYARDNGLRMYALNAPREVIAAVRTIGFEALTPEQRRYLPPSVNTDNDEHRRMIRAALSAHDEVHRSSSSLDEEGLFRAQATWDAVLGWNAVEALQRAGDPEAIMVLLTGAVHVAYGLGIERQIAPHFDGEIRSLITVPVRTPQGEPVEEVSAAYADYVWAVPSRHEVAQHSRAVDQKRKRIPSPSAFMPPSSPSRPQASER